jgi:hypothetical protein
MTEITLLEIMWAAIAVVIQGKRKAISGCGVRARNDFLALESLLDKTASMSSSPVRDYYERGDKHYAYNAYCHRGLYPDWKCNPEGQLINKHTGPNGCKSENDNGFEIVKQISYESDDCE